MCGVACCRLHTRLCPLCCRSLLFVLTGGALRASELLEQLHGDEDCAVVSSGEMADLGFHVDTDDSRVLPISEKH